MLLVSNIHVKVVKNCLAVACCACNHSSKLLTVLQQSLNGLVFKLSQVILSLFLASGFLTHLVWFIIGQTIHQTHGDTIIIYNKQSMITVACN